MQQKICCSHSSTTWWISPHFTCFPTLASSCSKFVHPFVVHVFRGLRCIAFYTCLSFIKNPPWPTLWSWTDSMSCQGEMMPAIFPQLHTWIVCLRCVLLPSWHVVFWQIQLAMCFPQQRAPCANCLFSFFCSLKVGQRQSIQLKRFKDFSCSFLDSVKSTAQQTQCQHTGTNQESKAQKIHRLHYV